MSNKSKSISGIRLSDQEFHALYCPVKNTKSALLLVACFSLTAFVNWKGLHKAPEHSDFVVLLFAIAVVAMLAKWLGAFTCFRERLVLSLVIVSLVAGEVERFVPAIVSQHLKTVKFGHLALSLFCLLVSLTMFVQSIQSPNAGPSYEEVSIARQRKQNLLILLVITLTVLVLGAMLYLLPFPH